MTIQIDIIFDGVDGDMKMKTLYEFDFISAIKKEEEFLLRYSDSAPEILSARQHTGNDIQDIKLKVLTTLNERRKHAGQKR